MVGPLDGITHRLAVVFDVLELEHIVPTVASESPSFCVYPLNNIWDGDVEGHLNLDNTGHFGCFEQSSLWVGIVLLEDET